MHTIEITVHAKAEQQQPLLFPALFPAAAGKNVVTKIRVCAEETDAFSFEIEVEIEPEVPKEPYVWDESKAIY